MELERGKRGQVQRVKGLLYSMKESGSCAAQYESHQPHEASDI